MAKCIMIQGTMSSAGKSLLAAALCRIFHQDGYSVAPFKSQNMALNSFVTSEGLEMGRAQVMQAEAACIEPSVLMNPILLKPTSDTGSQVIVNGEVLGVMSAKDYFSYKKNLWKPILDAYNALSAENDIIVIEGAGSPAEINLKQNDIVNMGLAQKLNAPVLLVGDIDRGGVFAQLIGTLVLLEEQERSLVKGLVINKFRGDKGILAPGIKMLEDKASLPVVGTVPYMKLLLDDEDSLTERFSVSKDNSASKSSIDIAVIRLPHISNFSDFTVFDSYPDVRIRYVSRACELGIPDLLIIPGTKSTSADMRWLRESGFEGVIRSCAGETAVMGICGGFQILGNSIEEDGLHEKGLGLLPVKTVFGKSKIRTRVSGTLHDLNGFLAPLSGLAVEGYEIHSGVTESECRVGKESPFAYVQDSVTGQKKQDGCFDGNIYGTYIHGIFDADGVCPALIKALAERKGVAVSTKMVKSVRQIKNEQYDLLAQTVRASMDMPYIYDIINSYEC
ncbi:MAG: cobyric acid synthase [Treponema sp.]|nr:cobyric acid synthase [Treponema sp.]